MSDNHHSDPVDIPSTSQYAHTQALEEIRGYRPFHTEDAAFSDFSNSTMFPRPHRPRRSTFSTFANPLTVSAPDGEKARMPSAHWAGTIAAFRDMSQAQVASVDEGNKGAAATGTYAPSISPLFRRLSLTNDQGNLSSRSNALTYQYPFGLHSTGRAGRLRADSASSDKDNVREVAQSPSTSSIGDSFPVTPIDTFALPAQNSDKAGQTTAYNPFSYISFGKQSVPNPPKEGPTFDDRNTRVQRSRSVTLAGSSRLETIHARAPLQTTQSDRATSSGTQRDFEVAGQEARASPPRVERQLRNKQPPPVMIDVNGDVFFPHKPSTARSTKKAAPTVPQLKTVTKSAGEMQGEAAVADKRAGPEVSPTQPITIEEHHRPAATSQPRRFSFTGFGARSSSGQTAGPRRAASPTGERMLQGQFLD